MTTKRRDRAEYWQGATVFCANDRAQNSTLVHENGALVVARATKRRSDHLMLGKWSGRASTAHVVAPGRLCASMVERQLGAKQRTEPSNTFHTYKRCCRNEQQPLAAGPHPPFGTTMTAKEP